MNQIQKPIFKKKDEDGKWKELVLYLTEIADKMNWNIMTLQKQTETNKKNIKIKQENLDDNSKVETDDVAASAKFKKTGNIVTVIFTFNLVASESLGPIGSAKMVIPVEMFPTFYDSSVPVFEKEKVKIYLGRDKITIDYDFPATSTEEESSKDASFSCYFQYVS